jgi:hypothetical protein
MRSVQHFGLSIRTAYLPDNPNKAGPLLIQVNSPRAEGERTKDYNIVQKTIGATTEGTVVAEDPLIRGCRGGDSPQCRRERERLTEAGMKSTAPAHIGNSTNQDVISRRSHGSATLMHQHFRRILNFVLSLELQFRGLSRRSHADFAVDQS